jgi:hypothetical protein
MYILITAANSAQAFRFKNSIGSENILFGDYLDLPEVLVRSGKMLQLPDPSGNSYAHRMLSLCLDKNIHEIYALREAEQQQLFAAEQLFNEYGIHIFAPQC